MGIVLLLLTLALEGVSLLWSYWFGSHLLGAFYASTFHQVLPRWHVTPAMIGLLWVALNLLLHLVAVASYVRRMLHERAHLGQPGLREITTVERIYRQLLDAATHMQPPMTITWPRSFDYRPGRGTSLHFLGRRLVIDEWLLSSSYLKPLLAQQLALYNSSDLWIRLILDCLPPPALACTVIMGWGIGIGPWLLALLWPWYWRRRVYAADRFAASLGQGQSLINALDRLVRPREQRQLLLKRAYPYVAERIDRLMRLQQATGTPASMPQKHTQHS